MNMLDQVTEGVLDEAMIHLVYGPNGVGKTTFAASFPNCLFADIEKGSKRVTGIKRLTEFPDFKSYKALVDQLLVDPREYKTFVTDSLERLVDLVIKHVCEEGKVESIEDYGKGFGKGFVRVREIMLDVMESLRLLTEKHQVTVIIIGHAQEKQHTDPLNQQTYTRYSLRVNEKVASMVKDLCDNVLFITYKSFFTKDQQGKTQAFSDGERIIKTQWRIAYDAKNRLGLPTEITHPIYENFVKAAATPIEITVPAFKEEIMELIKGIQDPETQTAATKRTLESNTIAQLVEIKNRIKELTVA